MASVLDVAEYILQQQGTMTSWKLEKLVYYCQAWSLVWDEAPLFDEKIEAWANGPVVRELFDLHKGLFTVSHIPGGDPSKLSYPQKNVIDAVLNYYGDKTAQWLSDLTHMENPWQEARAGIPDGANSENEITLASLHIYYSSIPKSDLSSHVQK
jgi:uncharacterized phage-associated protein